MLKDVLRLWTAARCIETWWYPCEPGRSTDIDNSISGAIPEVTDHQLAVVVIAHVLDPLRSKVFDDLTRLYKRSKKTLLEKIILFLTKYILLHSMETVLKQQRRVAKERNSPVSSLIILALSSDNILFSICSRTSVSSRSSNFQRMPSWRTSMWSAARTIS